MKPHAKRIFTVLLSLLLAALPSAALCAFAADTPAVLASGYCGGEGDGTNLTWKLTDDGVVTISGLGAMADYMETRVSEETGETITSHSATPWEEAIMQHVMQNCDPALLEQLNDGVAIGFLPTKYGKGEVKGAFVAMLRCTVELRGEHDSLACLGSQLLCRSGWHC